MMSRCFQAALMCIHLSGAQIRTKIIQNLSEEMHHFIHFKVFYHTLSISLSFRIFDNWMLKVYLLNSFHESIFAAFHKEHPRLKLKLYFYLLPMESPCPFTCYGC